MEGIISKEEFIILSAVAFAGLFSYLSGLDGLLADGLSHRTSIGISLFFSLEFYVAYMLASTAVCLRKDRRAASALIIAVILVFLMQAAFTVFAQRARPPQSMPIGNDLLSVIRGAGGSSSFFSGHTASVVVVCTIFYLMRFHPRAAALIGLPIVSSRLTLIQHYLSDILGGIVFGYVTAILTYKAITWKTSKIS